MSRVATSPVQAAAGAAVVTCFPYQYALPDFVEGGRCVPRQAVDTVVRRTCRAATAPGGGRGHAPGGGRGHAPQDWWSQQQFWGRLSGAARAAVGSVGPGRAVRGIGPRSGPALTSARPPNRGESKVAMKKQIGSDSSL